MDERVADVRFGTSCGSGYLVTSDLVLTAAHVVPPGGMTGSIRPLLHQDTVLDATERWRHPTLDIALLRITKPWPSQSSRRVEYGQLNSDTYDAQFKCASRGFPRASRDVKGRREDHPLRGQLNVVVRSDAPLSIRATNGAPFNPDDWSGFSGAAVFCQDLLVGIVTFAHQSFQSEVLRAIPIAECVEDLDFCSATGVSRGSLRVVWPDEYFKRLNRKLQPLHCYIDRKDQLDAFADHAGVDGNLRRSFGACFLIPATADDAPGLLVERIVSHYKSTFGDIPAVEAVPTLHWPGRIRSDVAGRLASLQEDAVQKLGLTPGASSSPKAFAANLAALPRTRGLYWTMPEDAAATDAELLVRWLDFLEQARTLGSQLLAFMSSSTAPVRRGLMSWGAVTLGHVLDREIERGRLIAFPALHEIDLQTDLAQWFGYLLQKQIIHPQDEGEVRLRIDAHSRSSRQRLRPLSIQIKQALEN